MLPGTNPVLTEPFRPFLDLGGFQLGINLTMTAVLAAVVCALAYQPAARVHQPARPALFARTVPLVRTSLPRASPSALLDVRGLALASALPSLLGLWKREYTVSYGAHALSPRAVLAIPATE
jgi:hypothetical protein